MAVAPALSFLELPTDIHFEILWHMDLREALPLLHSASKFLNSRELWSHILHATRKILPIPCPPRDDLSLLTCSALRNIAYRAIFLWKNWSLPRPKAQYWRRTETKHYKPTSTDECFLAVIPGTHLVVTGSAAREVISCWDTKIGSCVGVVRDVGKLHSVSYPSYTVPGRMVLAYVSSYDSMLTAYVTGICVNYAERTSVKFEQTFRTEITLGESFSHSYITLAINDRYLVALAWHTQKLRAGFGIKNLQSAPESKFIINAVPEASLPEPSIKTHLDGYISGNTLNVIKHARNTYTVHEYTLSSDLSASNIFLRAPVAQPPLPQYTSNIHNCPSTGRSVSHTSVLPGYRVRYSFQSPQNERTEFEFSFPRCEMMEAIPAASGRHVLVHYMDGTAGDRVKLLRLAGDKSCSIHDLHLPLEINLVDRLIEGRGIGSWHGNRRGSIEIDESLGVVYLLMDGGIIWAVGYS
ncbi:uncharacterized protein EV420DRAFT_863081 [Desarmillaria tabescens]|uniref:F-box domain-containing protein n=1 Tax=Armillaria tabescens TaxID=1929756 RepID=A0AA39JU32_ARMTA|nr:uncharacterized protein EV420DRAFT_863081 [Desarmillaria tabescens]KAK0447866.1 hypothetical protein EV420DRAFT_863081 [Desarmillaria tabescens]